LGTLIYEKMLRLKLCKMIFSDGSTYGNFILHKQKKYLLLRQDFNNHPFWAGHLNLKVLKEKKYLLSFHNKYKVKSIIYEKRTKKYKSCNFKSL